MTDVRTCSHCSHVMIEGYDWERGERCFRCLYCGRTEYDLVPAYWIREDNISVEDYWTEDNLTGENND